MAVFDSRAELNKQMRHKAANWDDSLGLKMLGFKKTGERSLYGQILGMAPGLNTATHAIAKGTSGGDTKKALGETMDETIYKDFSGLAFGAQIAKSVVGGGGGAGGAMSKFGGGAMGGAAGGAAGGAGGGLGKVFSGMGGKGGGMDVAGLVGKGDDKAPGVIDNISGGTEITGLQKGGAATDVLMDGMGKDVPSIGGGGDKKGSGMMDAIGGMDVQGAFDTMSKGVEKENVKNPFPVGTPEHDAFKKKEEAENKKSIGEATKGGAQRWMQDIQGGSITESGANFATSIISDYKAQKQAAKKYSSGQQIMDPTFDYLA